MERTEGKATVQTVWPVLWCAFCGISQLMQGLNLFCRFKLSHMFQQQSSLAGSTRERHRWETVSLKSVFPCRAQTGAGNKTAQAQQATWKHLSSARPSSHKNYIWRLFFGRRKLDPENKPMSYSSNIAGSTHGVIQLDGWSIEALICCWETV